MGTVKVSQLDRKWGSLNNWDNVGKMIAKKFTSQH